MTTAEDILRLAHVYAIKGDYEPFRTAVESLVADAERYRLLAPRLLAADFAYGEPPTCVIVFEWPKSARISADLGASIDAALGGQP